MGYIHHTPLSQHWYRYMETNDTTIEVGKPILNAQAYRVWRHLVQVVLPAFGSAYFSLAQLIPEIPAAEVVVGVVVILVTFLGSALGISTRRYNQQVGMGEFSYVTDQGGAKKMEMRFHGNPELIPYLQEVRFKVRSQAELSTATAEPGSPLPPPPPPHSR